MTTYEISTIVGSIYRITITNPESTTEYIVGEKEKDFFVRVFKDKAVVEILESDTQESSED